MPGKNCTLIDTRSSLYRLLSSMALGIATYWVRGCRGIKINFLSEYYKHRNARGITPA